MTPHPDTRRPRHNSRPVDEHAWHACPTPPPPADTDTRWPCPDCHQVWIWRRPPRPTAQWIRATPEDN